MHLDRNILCAALVATLLLCGRAQAETTIEPQPWEQQIVDLTNAQRAQYGLPALKMDGNLMLMARRHNSWMVRSRSFSHSNMNVAENIAMGQNSPQDVVNTWMNSPGHRANILRRGIGRIGVSAYTSSGGQVYFTQQFTP